MVLRLNLKVKKGVPLRGKIEFCQKPPDEDSHGQRKLRIKNKVRIKKLCDEEDQ